MPSPVGTQFNSLPSLLSLQQLAGSSPSEALEVVQNLARRLKSAGLNPAQQAEVEALLHVQATQLQDVVHNSQLLRQVFPETTTGDFATCIQQLSNPESIGWAATQPPPRVGFTGTVVRDPTQGTYTLTTAGGRTFQLEDSPRIANTELKTGWMEGFLNVGEGVVTIQGTISNDGKKVLVEGYAPGSNPDFLYGRVAVYTPMGVVTGNLTPQQIEEALGPNGRVVVKTSRGEVELTDPNLKAMLVRVPRLGIILPGEVITSPEGRLTSNTSSDFFYALGGRFRETKNLGNGVYEAHSQYAYNAFMGPTRCAGETAEWRFNNSANQRNWVGGRFVFDGDPPHFEAHYLSNDLGNLEFTTPQSTEANAAQNLLAGAELVDRVAGDFKRQMGPPGVTPQG